MDSITIKRPDETEVNQRNVALAIQADKLRVDSTDSYQAAAIFLREIIVPMRKEIKDTFLKPKQAADQAHKVVCAAEKTHLDKVSEAEKIVKEKMGTYHSKVEAERKAQEEEQRKAREEAARKQREAEAEEQRKADEENERRRKEEEDKRIAAAQKLESEGKGAEAEKVLETPVEIEEVAPEPVAAIEVPEIAPVAAPPVAAGVSKRVTWRAEVTDLMTLVKAVASGDAPLECVMAQQVILNQKAEVFKENLTIPGVRAVSDSKMAVR